MSSDEPSAAPSNETASSHGNASGYWKNIGLFILIVLAALAVTFTTAFLFIFIANKYDKSIDLQYFGDDRFISLLRCLGYALTAGFILIFVKYINKTPITEYFDLKRFNAGRFLIWFMIFNACFLSAIEILVRFHIDFPAIRTAPAWEMKDKVLDILTGLILIPVAAEIMFRGMVFKGASVVRHSTLSAVLTSAVVWTLWHFSPNLAAISIMMLVGILLGVIRWRTGSLYPTIIIQAYLGLLSRVLSAGNLDIIHKVWPI